MKYIITTDATCDLPDGYAPENELFVIPMICTMDGVTYSVGESAHAENPLGRNLPADEFYKKMRAGSLPQTAQINTAYAEKIFDGFVADGLSVLHISFSSALSGSCNSVRMAADAVNERLGEKRVVIVDSLCASLGEGLLVHYALLEKGKGKSLGETAAWLEENKLHLCHYFTVDDLFHLHRGGRVSRAAAIVGTMLGIKPLLHVDDEGRLIPIGKVRGRRQALTSLVDSMAKRKADYENKTVFISHGGCLEDAEFVRDLVAERFGVTDFTIHPIGPIIGTHSGPGTVALFFLGDHR